MIEQLISEGKYEDALKLLEGKTDEDSIYNRATCLYYLEKYDELVAYCELYLESAGKHYYELLLLDTDCLTKLGNYDKAISLLAEELRMPWIPMEYEDKIKAAYDYLVKQLNNKETIESPLNKLDDEELFNLLDKVSVYSAHGVKNEDFDISLAVECLNIMSRRNIRLFLRNIQGFLEDHHKVSDLKVILIEILKDQGVNQIFKYVNSEGMFLVNPINSSNLFANADIDGIVNLIVDTFNLKDMSILDYIKRLLVAYLVKIYPNVILKDENKYIAGAIYAVAHSDNKIELDLNDVTEKLDLNGTLFKKYHEKILNVEIY